MTLLECGEVRMFAHDRAAFSSRLRRLVSEASALQQKARIEIDIVSSYHSRARRKKCDEARPQCRNCREREESCEYSKKRPSKALPPLALLPSTALIQSTTLQSHEAQLVHHFRTQVVRLICFPSTEHKDPFHQYILPAAHGSTLVQTAVEAVGAAHQHALGVGTLSHAAALHNRALRTLAETLSQTDSVVGVVTDQALGASLLLVYYEIVLGGSAKVAQCHLRGAKTLVEVCRATGNADPKAFRFLLKTCQYFDIMVALSLRERPLGFLSAADDFAPGVDGTFGLLGTLWPLMQTLAEVLATSGSSVEKAEATKLLIQQLQSWCPEEAAQPLLDERDADHQTMLQIAKAYKNCSLLTLLKHTSSLSAANESHDEEKHSSGDRVEAEISTTYREVLDSLLRACVLSGPMATLVWPLYTVGMSAVSAADKTITQHIFAKLNERQHMKVVECASKSVESAWSSKKGLDPGAGPPDVLLC